MLELQEHCHSLPKQSQQNEAEVFGRIDVRIDSVSLFPSVRRMTAGLFLD